MASTNFPPLHISPTPEEVVTQLAEFIVPLAARSVAARGRFTVALSGGSSPKKLYERLATPPYREQVEWERVFFFFGDERYVPPTDAESNYRLARETLFEPLAIAPEQVFAVDTALPPAGAARQYSARIEQFFQPAPAHFDLVLLGLGDNSHTASLFPHTPVLAATAAQAQEVFVEEKQAYRITLTAPLLNQAATVVFLVYGAGKAAAVQHVLTGPRDVAQFPAQLIRPSSGNLHWFLDADAAALLAVQHT
ncbi:6-phosphogluconolactonase [Hymenobacter sp. HSC-4F20]|uniref:6-phosphogluconolactonase n=1 Tax=Hymenobacter sp. HSC-4F20 TaxID=2864135 RepID=UPI001C73BB70|nr:6-phosphogluconolactonase [Hymenobacter sp. HSC-4F20]MBX0292993.1 6-phosphogluconolactonase [Hymenobacter sp. HSC-4F20]